MKIRAGDASGTTLTFSGNGGNSATTRGDDTVLIGADGGADGVGSTAEAAATFATLGASATWMLSSFMILTRTGAAPLVSKPRSCEARRDTSIMRPRANGPRSLTRSCNVRPLSRLVTWTMLGIGRV